MATREPSLEVSLYCIDVYPDRSCIEPIPPASIAQPLLEFTCKTFNVDKEGQVVEEAVDGLLWSEDTLEGEVGLRDSLLISTGLVSSLATKLREDGFEVEIHDHRQYGDRFEVAEKIVRQAGGEERAVIASVRAEPRGQIEVTGSTQAYELMALIMRLYPAARTLIPVTTNSHARAVRERLRRLTQRPIQVRLPGRPLQRGRTVVAPYASLNSCDGSDWDLILIPDATSVTNQQATRVMGGISLDNTRIYAFVGLRRSTNKRNAMRLEAIAGPVIHKQLPDKVGVRVLAVPTPECRRTDNPKGLAFKKAAYWENERRNEFVAAVAMAFQQGSVKRLKRYGVPVRRGVPQIRGGQEPRVVVLVESTVHADQIAKWLPGWEVQTQEAAAETYEGCADIITTEVAAAKHGLPGDVVIVASGEATGLNPPNFPPEMWNDDELDVLVVDFTDDFDPEAEDRFARRRRDYRHYGWEEIGSEAPGSQ